jgi:hypothetical protein
MWNLVAMEASNSQLDGVPVLTFMIHPVLLSPPQNQWFSAQQFREFSEQCTVQTRSLANLIATATGNEPERVYQDMNQTTWFNAEQAKAYGLVNEVTTDLLPEDAELTAIYEDGTIRVCPARQPSDLTKLLAAINLPTILGKPGTGIN